jgi:hypothetical protein
LLKPPTEPVELQYRFETVPLISPRRPGEL